jgi:hypothetical protein
MLREGCRQQELHAAACCRVSRSHSGWQRPVANRGFVPNAVDRLPLDAEPRGRRLRLRRWPAPAARPRFRGRQGRIPEYQNTTYAELVFCVFGPKTPLAGTRPRFRDRQPRLHITHSQHRPKSGICILRPETRFFPRVVSKVRNVRAGAPRGFGLCPLPCEAPGRFPIGAGKAPTQRCKGRQCLLAARPQQYLLPVGYPPQFPCEPGGEQDQVRRPYGPKCSRAAFSTAQSASRPAPHARIPPARFMTS